MLIEDNIKYLDSMQQDRLLSLIDNKRHMVIVLLMLDCGLRVSEATSLTLSNFFFRERILRVKTLKRKNVYRDIPLTDRTVDAIADYIATLDTKHADQLLFPSTHDPSRPIQRHAVNRMLNRVSKKDNDLEGLHPHMLRHTYATRMIANNENIHTVKELLGHSSITSTEVYTHVGAEQLRSAVARLQTRTFLQRIKEKISAKPRRAIRLKSSLHDKLVVGRDSEIEEIQHLASKRVNVLVTGVQGIGKSILLKQINVEKIARFDEVNKQALQGLCLHILKNDKQKLKELLYKDDNELDTKITKESISSLCEIACRITEKQEYTLIIDDVTSITPRSVKILEQLRNHFVIVCAARQIPLDKSSFLTNFQRIELKNLNREYSILLIDKLSSDMMKDIEDYDLYKNHIYENCEGNPQYIIELIDRYRKEDLITVETVRRIRHTAAAEDIDLTPYVLLAMSAIVVLRYFGRATDDSSLTLVGSIAFVLAIFTRSLFRTTKRKFI